MMTAKQILEEARDQHWKNNMRWSLDDYVQNICYDLEDDGEIDDSNELIEEVRALYTKQEKKDFEQE
jgi:hypothetical protein